MLLAINNLSKEFAGRFLFQNLNLQINSRNRIGLIGDNGVGKTTLFRMIAGREPATDGTITTLPGVQIGYLTQELECNPELTVREEVESAFAEIDTIAEKMRDLEHEMARQDLPEDTLQDIMNQYSRLQIRFEAADGYHRKIEVDRILNGLGITPELQDRRIKTFSGGEQNIIGLAKILLSKPDVLLLDEPANHMDFKAMAWLENYLRNSDLATIIISHNRYLLDNVANIIWEMENQTVTEYTGNYSAHRAEKLSRLAAQQAAFDRQQKKVERLEFTIRRLKSWGMVYDNPKLIKRAKSMEKRIEKMDTVEQPFYNHRSIRLRFGQKERTGKIALDIANYSRRIGNRVLFDDISFLIQSGENVALLGANGTGKTTLFRDIMMEGDWENLTLRIGKSMRVGYYSQMHDTLNMKNTVLGELMNIPEMTISRASAMLHRFLFSRDEFDKKIKTLSGGEKSRVQIAKILLQNPNFLLLDEPTNHLDIKSQEQIEDALEEFDGTIFVISHDRYFLDKLIDRLIIIEPPHVRVFEGNFSEYWQEESKTYEEEAILSTQERQKKDHAKANGDQKKHKSKSKTKRVNKWAIERLEKEILELEDEKERLSREIDAAFAIGDAKKGAELGQKYTEVNKKLEDLIDEWAAVSDPHS